MDLETGDQPWIKPHASLDAIQKRDNWGRIFARNITEKARQKIFARQTKVATYDDTAINYSVQTHFQRPVEPKTQLAHYPDDGELVAIQATKFYLPSHVKMLRPPQPHPMTRKEQAEMLVEKINVTLNDFKLGGLVLDMDSIDKSIRDGTCTSVRISRGTMTDQDLIVLVEALESVATPASAGGSRDDPEASRPSCRLELIELKGQCFSAIGGGMLFSVLRRLPSLRTANFATSYYPKENIFPLAGALLGNAITTLILTQTGLDDEQAETLSGGLSRNTSLTRIDLAGNCLTEGGVRRLYLALLKHPSVAALDLSLNPVGDQGATWLSYLLAQGTGALSELRLDGAEIGSNGAETLLSAAGDAHARLRVLTLQDNLIERLGAEACAAVASSPWLERLSLAGNRLKSAFVLGGAALRSGSLRTLDLSRNRLTDASLTSARAVRYWETAGAGPAPRARPWLFALERRRRPGGGGGPFARRRPPSRLELLDLSGNGITDDGAIIVLRALVPLRRKQFKTQRARGEAYAAAVGTAAAAAGRCRAEPPRIVMSGNLIQSPELLEALKFIDTDLPAAERAMGAYARRRKGEFWEEWNKRYGWAVHRARLQHAAYRLWDSDAGRAARRAAFRATAVLRWRDADLDQGEDGMDEIEMAEEKHRLALERLKEQEDHDAAQARAVRGRAADTKADEEQERLRDEYDKTGDKKLLKKIKHTPIELVSGIKPRRAGSDLDAASTPRSGGGGGKPAAGRLVRKNSQSLSPRSPIASSPIAVRSAKPSKPAPAAPAGAGAGGAGAGVAGGAKGGGGGAKGAAAVAAAAAKFRRGGKG